MSADRQAVYSAIDPERMAQIAQIPLRIGSHQSLEDGACVMELASWVAGEPWSDAPQCACPVITAFLVSWNDSLPSDSERDRLLKPLIPLIVGSRSTDEAAERRSYLALDWLIRVNTPKWLDTEWLQTSALDLVHRMLAADTRDMEAL